jgi:hypothetical protein
MTDKVRSQVMTIVISTKKTDQFQLIKAPLMFFLAYLMLFFRVKFEISL